MRHARARAARAVIRRVGIAVPRIPAEAEEADQRIVVDIGATARRGGQRAGEVVADLAERGIVAVDTVLLGKPQRTGVAVDRQVVGQAGHPVILVDVVRLALVEQARDDPQPLAGGRGDAQFLAGLLEMIGADDALARVYRLAGIVGEIEIAGEPAHRGIERVIGLGIIGIVAGLGVAAIEIGAGIGEVPVPQLALDRQRCLDEAIAAIFGEEVLDLQVAYLRVIPIGAVAARFLVDRVGRDRPVLVEIDLERGAAAPDVGVVIVVLHERAVVHHHAALAGRARRRRRLRQEAAAAEHIVDIASIMLVETDQAERRHLVDRQVQHAFQLAADAALLHRVQLGIDTAIGALVIRLVGDDADRAGLGRGAVQRALWARQALDPGDVIDMHVEIAADRGDRLLVEIHADRGQRARMVAVAARGDAAHIDDVGPRRAAQRLERNRGQLLHIVLEVADVQLVELLGAERLDADGDVLQALAALLRGDDDLVGVAGGRRGGFGLLLGKRRCGSKHGGSQQ